MVYVRERTYLYSKRVFDWVRSVSDDPMRCDAWLDYAQQCRDFVGNAPFDLEENGEVPPEMVEIWNAVMEGNSPYYDKHGNRKKSKAKK